MTFAWPQLLWLLLVPLALLVWGLVRRRAGDADAHDKILRAEAGPHSLRLATHRTSAPSRARPWLSLALAFGVIAVARPQWGRLEEPVFDQAREILIAIDLSRSMLAPDVKPSRLDRAKLLTQSLLEKLSGERVGLIVFSGTAFLQSPLSSDYEILREFLPALDPTFLPEGGTNYDALINTALTAFGATGAADRFLIILSDGEATEDDWRSHVAELKNRGIRVIALGVGTTAGAMIPDGAGGLVKDERGAVVLSKLESNTLRELASATSGVYEDASTWVDLAAVLAATVEAGQKGQFLEKNTIRLVERFQWPLALALWFLLVSLYYEFPVRPKSRAITLRADVPATPPRRSAEKIATLLVLLLAPFSLLSPDVRAAEPAAAPEPPLLSKIVTRLANSSQRTARDWAEFGRETVTWGKRLQSAQQPVPEGPVRDALAAVELGSALDAGTTDWPKLRAELEALLQKPEDQQQQQQQQQQNQDQQKQDEQNQDQQQQQQQQQKDGSSQPQEKPEQQDQQQSSPEQEKSPPKQPQDDQKQSAFGKMEEQQPPPEQTQKVGGVPERKPGEQKPPTDPALALPLQKLDQLRDKDSPAELFQLMEDQKQTTPRKKTKDW
ncbi:VWA domain-containing protein [Opitutus terrae]|uniref:von Willebrand factor type A n=1 Tax=Opitutus terrae (strain DSM 11246 / JCM 15787 / PB90-1) TaxID=452637 RepID=B1ZS78_OPITP|nr:VWA domain-containing protein [Opitutus terrae]ACB75677.1 von Willebrand factor type A [Opitutus terrae PB90-1]